MRELTDHRRTAEPRKLSEIPIDFLNPATLRRIVEQEKARKRAEAEKRTIVGAFSVLSRDLLRKKITRTEKNTSTTGRPLFYWGQPAQSNPQATEGRKLKWTANGREKNQPEAKEQDDKTNPEGRARAPPTSRQTGAKNESTAPKKRHKKKAKKSRQGNRRGHPKKQGRNKHKQKRRQKRERRHRQRQRSTDKTRHGDRDGTNRHATADDRRNTLRN